MNKIAVDMFFQLFAATSYIYKPQNYKKSFSVFVKRNECRQYSKKEYWCWPIFSETACIKQHCPIRKRD